MRMFEMLAKLFEGLAEAGPSFLVVHDEGLAKLLEHVLGELERMAVTWDSLTMEQKAAAEAEAVKWQKSKRGEGQYAPADMLPTLTEYLKQKGGKARLGSYAYYLSRNERWILRYERGERG